MDKVMQAAIQVGIQQADKVLAFRQTALVERAKAIERAHAAKAGDLGDERAALDADQVRKVAGAGSSGVLIAEGDSWFDYPWVDVIEILEDHYGYDIESVAHKGDTVEDMAYSSGQLEELTRRLEKLLRRNTIPRAILLSGGGNDIAGPEFRMLLNHADSPISGLNQSVVSGVIDERIRVAYATIISAVTTICEQKIGHAVPIIVHGYDFPVPDGRGFLGGGWLLPGPWLEPGFRVKGYASMDQRKDLARDLIDRFNKMLLTLPADFNHVKYVDLRGTLQTGDADYQQWWDNELHPTRKGFLAVIEKIAQLIP